jgi:hypothetical protein
MNVPANREVRAMKQLGDSDLVESNLFVSTLSASNDGGIHTGVPLKHDSVLPVEAICCCRSKFLWMTAAMSAGEPLPYKPPMVQNSSSAPQGIYLTGETAASWFGACIFLIVSATILRSFFL